MAINNEIVKFENYSFFYPEGKKAVLETINFSINKGEFVLLCGRSGCGKSTLLRQLKNTLRPHGRTSGTILFEGTDIQKMDQRSESGRIGFVMQDPDSQIVTDKVWHELAFGLESLGYDNTTIRLRVAEMASYFGIQNWFYKDVEELSGGQKQILNLASVMAMNPSLLLLDEPTSQLDPIAAAEFLQTLQKMNRDLGITILITEHRLEELIPIVDKMTVMEDGEIIVCDKPSVAGMYLKSIKNEMFEAMPVPMKIYLEILQQQALEENCPLTVREGRIWVDSLRPKSCNDESGEKILIKSKNESKKLLLKSRVLEKEIPEIKLKDVWFRYEKDQQDVIKGLSMKIAQGEIYAILGGNGTGKSTAMSLISGVQRPWRGTILIEGKDIRAWNDRELYQGCLGVVPQNPQSLFVKKTVREELEEMIDVGKEKGSKRKQKEERVSFGTEQLPQQMMNEIIQLTELEEFMERHPYDLSGGEQQRLALAKILLLHPRILLLDEPTKGMDACFKKKFAEILKRIKEQGVTILMISHDIEFCATNADKCGLFFDGAIVTECTPKRFFSENSFYTTSANRMVRHLYPNAITIKDVIKCLTEK